MSPRGRRPGGTDTRAAIVDAARAEFADGGYDATSLRAIARRAEVDPALVHHYFDGKPALFAAVMQLPVDPGALVDRVIAGPREQIGESLVRAFLAVWDSPEGRPRFLALIRSAVTHAEAVRMLRQFLVSEVFGKVAAAAGAGRGGEGAADAELRAGLAASQVIGMAMMRYVIELEPVVTASHDDLARLVGPTVQRYLAP